MKIARAEATKKKAVSLDILSIPSGRRLRLPEGKIPPPIPTEHRIQVEVGVGA
jgi:hypothetical protein